MRRQFAIGTFVALALALTLSACGAPASDSPAGTTAGGAATPLPEGSVQITGAGATFPLPLYSQWTYAYQYVDPAVAISYNGVGSGAGKTAIIKNTVDFAGSDSLLNDQNYTDGKDLQMYPMVAGAVVPVYNIALKAVPTPAAGQTAAKLPALVLDRQTLVDIFNGKITTWDDPAIVALNPDLKDFIPAGAKITTVHRSDGSGTTELFTKSLTAFSADWKAGGAASIEWPIKESLGGKGNAGVAALVVSTPNSIGYVELSYALSNNLNFASLVNKAGKTVIANGASVQSAMADFASSFDNNPHLTATIVDGTGEGSWPIAGYTYIILHTQSMTDCVKAGKIMSYLHWALTDKGAAEIADKLGYSVLPDAVRTKVLEAYGKVTCDGKPVQ